MISPLVLVISSALIPELQLSWRSFRRPAQAPVVRDRVKRRSRGEEISPPGEGNANKSIITFACDPKDPFECVTLGRF